ncbi:hypothetical protein [Novosphingobium capsulatum]|uniref:LPD3 domain-containing protein n=1 Tax=Novosphingobium capsulatum TaxID=13688 RepID=UPI00078970AE|nr:hypothetical protein [Novosphingobium capsulatum]WQD92767.1 hypothetical protein U0041_17560 [Novosphingobium capsulatum]
MAGPTNPFDYAEQFNPSNTATGSPGADAIKRQRTDQIRFDILSTPQAPDQMARTVRTARDLGTLPADVEDSIDDAERALRANNFGKLIDQHPTIGQWAAGDPRGAVAASDDTKSLGILGSAWGMLKQSYNPVLAFAAGVDAFDRQDVGSRPSGTPAPLLMALTASLMGDQQAAQALPSPRRAGGALLAGTAQMGRMVTTVPAWGWDVMGVPQAYNLPRMADKGLERAADYVRPQDGTWVEQQVLGGVENVPTTVATMLGGIGLRAAGLSSRAATIASIMVPSAQQGGESYFRARDQGVGRAVASVYGILDTAAEAGGEYLGQKAFLDSSGSGRNILSRYIRSQIPDLLGEEATTLAEDTTAWLFLPSNKDKTLGDLVAQLPGDLAGTAIQTLVGGGLSHVTISTLEHTLGMAASQQREAVGQQLGQRAAAAMQAFQDGHALNLMAKAAEGSTLRQRDPEAYADLLRVASENGHIPPQVYVPADAITAYQQSDSYDQFDDPFADYQGQIAEAQATGGDVVLPSDFALTALPGTSAWAAIKDDIRLRPGGMSLREAQAFQEHADAEIKQVSERVGQQDSAAAAEQDQRAAMVEARTQELQNAGFTPRMAGIYAELDVLRAAVRSERNGRPLDPKDFGSTIRAVLPESLAEIQRADQWDTVIHAMRKRASAEIPQGKTLLEWINDRGGINDVGGDLKAMGLDRWHMNDKGKKPVPIKGRRKLIRDYDPRQAEMVGAISGNGEYGLDTTLSAAIDAGYFPELQAAQFEAGPSAIDQNTLLDAIREELAGKPRYAEAPKIDPARAAADDLRAMLEANGRDPDGMTDAEIRAAISEYTSGAQGQGYEHSSDPIVEVHGDEIAPESLHGADLRKVVVDWYKEHLQGKSVLSAALSHDVIFARPGKMKKFSADEQKLRAVAVLREIIAQGELVSSQAPYDQKPGGDSIKAYHRLRATIMIGGQPKIVDVTIREVNNGTFYYDHVLPENNTARNPSSPGYNSGTREPGSYEQSSEPSDNFNMSIGAVSQGPRGRFIPGKNGRGGTIELFQSRNPSTLIHEFGHQWLEELRADAAHPDASDQLRADWDTVKAWFGSLGHPLADDGTIPVEAHEYWARGVERYLMEGRAPSTGLARLFETVRGWMLSIYRKVDALRAPISPEIREVMERLLATDDEIAAQRNALAMQPAITDPKAMGMTGAEFGAYTQLAQGARDQANADLLAKTMASIRRQRTKAWNDERAVVRADEAQRLDAAPLLKSLRLMRETPIDREWLEDRFGRDVLDLLPRQVPPLHKAGGVNPDALAEMAGFDSAQQMIEVLIGAQRQHLAAKESGDTRGLRERMIDNAADEEMQRRHGDDPFNDGSIEEEAIAAVNNDLAGELLATELRYLGRRAGQQATPYQVARAWARQRVRSGVIVEQASLAAIQRYTKAVSKAGRDAEKAIIAAKMNDAFVAKQRQMLSAALLAESKAAYDEVMRAQDRLGKIAKRKTMKSVDQEYLEQAHALLDAVQLGPRSQKSIERQGKWEAWAAQQEADGREIVVPASFEATLRGTHWSRLTVENMLGLDDAVNQVMHLGRLKQTLLDNQEEREWNDIFDEAERAADNIAGAPPRDLTDPNMLERIKAGALAVDASLLKLETVFDWLDGGDANGVFNRIAFRPIAEAQDRENAMLADYYGRIKALFQAVPAEDAARWRDKMEMPWSDVATGAPMRMERSKVIAMALNIGNAGNFQRLADGYRINPGAIEAFLNDTLTAGEWQFVQSVWDTIGTLWPSIEQLERRVNGVAPEKVEARAFDTPHGPMRGGYYPAIYDTTRDYRAEERGGKESDLLGTNYTRATTRARSTKERAEKVTAPILLDLGVINRHLGELIHDITHREAVIQANRFLTSERVSRAVDAALGPEIRRQFRPWVKFVANSWAMERAGNEGFGKWLGKLRANVTVVGMGLRATTMVTQLAGYSNSVEVVGEAAMAKAIARFSASPIETANFALERSGELRARMDTLDRDIRNQINAMATVNPVGKLARQALDAKRFMFHGIGYMDRVVSVPTWMAGYSNAIAAGATEADAIYAGDKAVRQSQGAGSPKDMAAIVRGTGKWGEATKLFTMFYSYFSAQYQRQRTLARDVRGVDERRSRNLPKLASRAFFLLVVPPLLTELIKAGLTGGGGPDDDEWWSEWVIRKLLANAIGPIPLARDVFEPTWNAVAGNKVFSASLTPMQRAADSLAQAGRDVGKLARGEETKHATKDVLETTGYLTGLVPGQVASATQFLVDVSQGDADPQGVGDWIEGLTTGKVKDH